MRPNVHVLAADVRTSSAASPSPTTCRPATHGSGAAAPARRLVARWHQRPVAEDLHRRGVEGAERRRVEPERDAQRAGDGCRRRRHLGLPAGQLVAGRRGRPRSFDDGHRAGVRAGDAGVEGVVEVHASVAGGDAATRGDVGRRRVEDGEVRRPLVDVLPARSVPKAVNVRGPGHGSIDTPFGRSPVQRSTSLPGSAHEKATTIGSVERYVAPSAGVVIVMSGPTTSAGGSGTRRNRLTTCPYLYIAGRAVLAPTTIRPLPSTSGRMRSPALSPRPPSSVGRRRASPFVANVRRARRRRCSARPTRRWCSCAYPPAPAVQPHRPPRGVVELRRLAAADRHRRTTCRAHRSRGCGRPLRRWSTRSRSSGRSGQRAAPAGTPSPAFVANAPSTAPPEVNRATSIGFELVTATRSALSMTIPATKEIGTLAAPPTPKVTSVVPSLPEPDQLPARCWSWSGRRRSVGRPSRRPPPRWTAVRGTPRRPTPNVGSGAPVTPSYRPTQPSFEPPSCRRRRRGRWDPPRGG